VQPGGRLVEHVDSAVGAHVCRELQPLPLAARQRGERLAEPKVAEQPSSVRFSDIVRNPSDRNGRAPERSGRSRRRARRGGPDRDGTALATSEPMSASSSIPYVPRDPRAGTLYPLVEQWWPRVVAALEEADDKLPDFVRSTFERYLDCGIAERGFVRMACSDCGLLRALPMSCKRRGLCPGCGARRKEDLARHLVERVLPHVAVRQYVLSPPAELVGLLAARPKVMSALIRIFNRCDFDAIHKRVRRTEDERPKSGAVVLVQRFTKNQTDYAESHRQAHTTGNNHLGGPSAMR
jgi:hypothetical protein